MILSRKRVWVLMAVITLVGAFFRFYQLGRESVWDGEIFTLLFAQFDWSVFFQSVSTFSAHPPLWFALSKLVIAGGWNETLLRYPAAFAGVLSVPALYVLSKRLTTTQVGVIAAALMAFSPLDVIFSQNARNYAFFVLLTIFLLYGAVRATEAKPRAARWWVLFVTAGAAGLYTHYLFVLPLAGTTLAVAIKLIADAMGKAGGWKNFGKWWGIALVSARWFLAALIAIVALYLPWTPSVGSAFLDRQLTRESANEEEETALTLADAPRLLKDFGGDSSWGLVLVAALAVAGIAMAWRDGKRAPLFWFGIAILLPILVTVLLAPRRLPAKYLIYVLPAYLLFVAYGIAAISEFVLAYTPARFLRSERFVYAPTLALVGLVALAAAPNMPYWNGTQTVFTGKGWAVVDEWKEWRAAGNYVTAQAGAGDFVLFPLEARALTARSIVPYFSGEFLRKLYSAPPTTTAWWVSETEDVPPTNAPFVRDEEQFGNLVVQRLEHSGTFREFALPNAGFEKGFEGWNRSSDALEWATDAAEAQEGGVAAKLTLARPEITTLISDPFAATPEKFYRVTARVKNPTVGFYTVSPQLFVNFSDATGRAPRRTRLATIVPTEDPEWVLMVADGIVPEGATTARVEFAFRDYAAALGPVSWVDDVRVWVEE